LGCVSHVILLNVGAARGHRCVDHSPKIRIAEAKIIS